MRLKILCRNPDDYLRETRDDIHKIPRNYASDQHPFQQTREYTRALNAIKLERTFAKPFVASLDGHRDGVRRICKHPNRLSTILSGSYDGEIRIWDLPSKKCLAVIPAHTGYVRGLCVDPANGDSFVSVGDDCQVKQWRLPDPINGKLDEPIHSVALDTTCHDISHHWQKPQFATCGDGVDVWEHMRNTPIRSFNWGVDSVQCLRYNPVETELLLGAADRSLILYDSRGQAPIKKVVMKMRSNSIAWNPMEAYMFTAANEDYNLYSFDIRQLSRPCNIHMDHTAAVMDVDFAPTGRELVSCSYDKSIRIFPCDKGRSREIYHTKRMQRVMTVAWTMDNKFILSGSDEMNLRIWKARASEKIGTLRPREERAIRYGAKLKEKYGEHPEIGRIKRHKHVPKHIYNAKKEGRIMKESAKRKEANRRAHRAPGTVPFWCERDVHVATE